jgi:hypothetical protein
MVYLKGTKKCICPPILSQIPSHIKSIISKFLTKMNQINSQREQKKFHHEGYLYVRDKASADNTKIFWRCEKRWGTGGIDRCPGRVWTNAADDSYLSLRKPHTCAGIGNAAHVSVEQVGKI